MTTQPNSTPKPADAAAEVTELRRLIRQGVDFGSMAEIKTLLNAIDVLERDNELMARDLASVNQAFAVMFEEHEALRAFVEDVRDSKARAMNDEECVMAFVRLGNEAPKLLSKLAE